MAVTHVTSALARAETSENVFESVLSDRALYEAQAQAEAGSPTPWTVAYKDVFPLQGVTSTAGTRFLQAQSTSDHRVVKTLRDAGAVCVGVTTMSELGFSVLGENDAVPAPSNPFDANRVCGGSSSGSAAAVATGVVDVGIGTDSGGSVRLPAAWCGVVGYKPTSQLIPVGSALTFSPSLDVVGVITRTVSTAHSVAETLWEGTPELTESPVRLAACPSSLKAEADVMAVFNEALHRLRDHVAFVSTAPLVAPFEEAHKLRGHHGSIAADEGWQLWRDDVLAAGELASGRLRRWFAGHRPASDPHQRQRRQERADLVARFARHVRPGTVMVSVTSPVNPPTFDRLTGAFYDITYRAAQQTLWPLNELAAPAISIPCGHTPAGLPVGLQLYAPAGRDLDVLAAAAVAEDVFTRSSPTGPTERNQS